MTISRTGGDAPAQRDANDAVGPPRARPPRVLAAAFAAVPGSSPHASALLGLAAALRAEVDLVTVKTGAHSHLEHIGGARMLRVPVGGGGETAQRSAFCRAVRRQIESEPYDAIHVRGPIEGLVALEAKRQTGCRVVYEMGSFPDESAGMGVEKGWAAAHLSCLEGADVVLLPSEAATRSSSMRSRKEGVYVVRPGVDIDLFDHRGPPPGSAASDGVLAGTVPRLLYLGSLTSDRDPGTVIGAIREVRRRRPIRVLLAGERDAAARARIRRVVEAFGLEGVVDVRGEPPFVAIPRLISGADLCLVPAAAAPRYQDHGDVPMPLLEHAAGLRPIVAAGVPGVGELLRDEREALLYPPGDEEALAEAILAMLEDPELREKTAGAAYARVRACFSLGARRRELARIYETLFPGTQFFRPTTADATYGQEDRTPGMRADPGGRGLPTVSHDPWVYAFADEALTGEFTNAGVGDDGMDDDASEPALAAVTGEEAEAFERAEDSTGEHAAPGSVAADDAEALRAAMLASSRAAEVLFTAPAHTPQPFDARTVSSASPSSTAADDANADDALPSSGDTALGPTTDSGGTRAPGVDTSPGRDDAEIVGAPTVIRPLPPRGAAPAGAARPATEPGESDTRAVVVLPAVRVDSSPHMPHGEAPPIDTPPTPLRGDVPTDAHASPPEAVEPDTGPAILAPTETAQRPTLPPPTPRPARAAPPQANWRQPANAPPPPARPPRTSPAPPRRAPEPASGAIPPPLVPRRPSTPLRNPPGPPAPAATDTNDGDDD